MNRSTIPFVRVKHTSAAGIEAQRWADEIMGDLEGRRWVARATFVKTVRAVNGQWFEMQRLAELAREAQR